MSLPLMFALAFPVDVPLGEPVVAIELPAEAYAVLTTDDLRDLAVVDANGQPQTISVVPPSAPRETPPAALPLPAPIALPADASDPLADIAVEVGLDIDGRLSRIQLASTRRDTGPGPREWLLDAGAVAEAGYSGLRVAAAPGPSDFRTLVDVRGSDDLVRWTPIVDRQPLLRVGEGSQRIERLELRFPTVRHRFLMLRSGSGSSAVPAFVGASLLRAPDEPRAPERTRRLQAQPTPDPATRFVFPNVGRLPVTRVAIDLQEPNSVQSFSLSTDVGDARPVLSQGTAWRLAVDGESLHSAALPVTPPGSGALHLTLGQPALAPSLVLHYRPAQVVVVAAGTPPFQLLAGSGRYRHRAVRLDDALAGLRAARGRHWSPPLVPVGAAEPLGGSSALLTTPPLDGGRVALWAVLVLGATLVGGLAWRLLLRTPPTES